MAESRQVVDRTTAHIAADALQSGWRNYVERRRELDKRPPRKRPDRRVWASRRSRCVRKMALDLIHPEDRVPPTPEGMCRMDRGNNREDAIVSRLLQCGEWADPPFKVTSTQTRFEIEDPPGSGRIVQSGKFDVGIEFPTLNLGTVAEIKAGEAFLRCETIEDINRGIWTEHAPDQLLSYLYAENLPLGFVIVDRFIDPLPVPILLEEHLDRVQTFLSDSGTAVAANRGEIELPPCTTDQTLCGRCDHLGKSCMPEKLGSGAGGTALVMDEELEQLVDKTEENRAAAKAFERDWKHLRGWLDGCERVLCGPYLLEGKWSRKKIQEYPPDVAEEVAELEARLALLKKAHTKVIDKGTHTLEVVRLEP